MVNKKIDMHVTDVPNVVLACYILHNVCEIRGDEFNEQWLEDFDIVQPDDVHISNTIQDGGIYSRELLVNYLEHH